uniref:ATP synthase F0 subunit 8 n=1 Tax=Opisthoteuthis sp. JN-2021 TaxID=2803192 RepID=A0A886RHS2_9MOLL|nr:ATP synthase F0 subunit 8 [Opisthoteuthis sp. JN-2021]
MPQLSPMNWMFLFSFFWFIMSLNSSIMWWNNSNLYNFSNINFKPQMIKYSWYNDNSYFFFIWWS